MAIRRCMTVALLALAAGAHSEARASADAAVFELAPATAAARTQIPQGDFEVWGVGLWPLSAMEQGADSVVVNGSWTIRGDRITGSWTHAWVDQATRETRARCHTSGSGRVAPELAAPEFAAVEPGTIDSGAAQMLQASLTLSRSTCEGRPGPDADAWADAVASELDRLWLAPVSQMTPEWRLADGTAVTAYAAALESQVGLDLTHVVMVQAPSFFHPDDAVAPRSFFGLLYRTPDETLTLVDQLDMQPEPERAEEPAHTSAP